MKGNIILFVIICESKRGKAGYKDEGMFVGIWVPSILGLANFFNTMKK